MSVASCSALEDHHRVVGTRRDSCAVVVFTHKTDWMREHAVESWFDGNISLSLVYAPPAARRDTARNFRALDQSLVAFPPVRACEPPDVW